MHATLLFQLQHTLERVRAQRVPLHKATDQFSLRLMLTSTLRILRELYAATSSSYPNYMLMRRIHLLEQQAHPLALPGEVGVGTWNLLHTYLLATLEATLQAETKTNQAEGRYEPLLAGYASLH